jgi:hypothetical protein
MAARPFTPREDRLLVAMVIEGLSDAAIAAELGRKTDSVRRRRLSLAARVAAEARA